LYFAFLKMAIYMAETFSRKLC